MAFVKLDCGILNSTIWSDHDARLIFLTALLLAEPREFTAPVAQLDSRMEETGFAAPLGWYGFVPAAGTGIIARTGGVTMENGLSALERLGAPELESRSPDHEGRRLIRVSGGYLVLNYYKYRDRDHTAAERQKRYRLRAKAGQAVPEAKTAYKPE